MSILSKEERSKVLEKMEKLLAHTGDGGVNPNEMAIANKKIKELVDEYGINLDELKGIEHKELLIEKIDVDVYYKNPKNWMSALAMDIAKFYECRVIRSGSVFYFIGFKLDAEVASEVYKRLYGMISRVSKNLSVNHNDFCFGVVISLRERLEEIAHEKYKDSSGNELMVVKKNTIDEQFKKMFPNTSKGKKAKYRLSSDYFKGVEYGKTVEIFKSISDKSKSSSGGSKFVHKKYIVKRKRVDK